MTPADHAELFPTHIFHWSDVLDFDVFQNLLNVPFKDKELLSFPALEQQIQVAVREVMNTFKINPTYDIEITEMWGNVSPKGKDHEYHNHPNNVFSGIFYLTDGEATRFVDPRPSNNVFQLEHEPNPHLGNIITMRAIPNTMLLFDSWLYHYVPANNLEEPRKTISFNVILRGEYGLQNSLARVKI